MAPGCSTMMCTACTGGPRPDPPTSEYAFIAAGKDKGWHRELGYVFTVSTVYNLVCETPRDFRENNKGVFGGCMCLGIKHGPLLYYILI